MDGGGAARQRRGSGLAVMLAPALPCHKHQQRIAEITDRRETLVEHAGQWCQTVVSAKPGVISCGDEGT